MGKQFTTAWTWRHETTWEMIFFSVFCFFHISLTNVYRCGACKNVPFSHTTHDWCNLHFDLADGKCRKYTMLFISFPFAYVWHWCENANVRRSCSYAKSTITSATKQSVECGCGVETHKFSSCCTQSHTHTFTNGFVAADGCARYWMEYVISLAPEEWRVNDTILLLI